MPATKLQRSINSVNEHLLSLQRSECSRPSSVGSGWTKLRIGLRLGFHADGISHQDITSDYQFYFGLVTNQSDKRGDLVNCDHYLGTVSRHPTSNWYYSSSDNSYIPRDPVSADVSPAILEKIESGTIVSSLNYPDMNPATVTEQYKIGALPTKILAVYQDFDKSPAGSDWDVTLRWYAGGTASIDHDTFLNAMIQSAPGNYAATQTVAVDEATFGSLTIPTIYWPNQQTHFLEIADLYVAELA